MSSQMRTIAVQQLESDIDESDIPPSGIVSCEVIPIAELDDETLEILYEQSPDWVMEKRPDWIKKNYPEAVN